MGRKSIPDLIKQAGIWHIDKTRLRAAGVSFEDRQDLLGHRSGRVTTHYSAAELSRLLDSAISAQHRLKT